MAKDSSFDVVSMVDMQEVDNAYGQAKKELSQRYDLKDCGAEISLDKASKKITVSAPSDFVAKQVTDVIASKLVKRGIDLNAVKWGDVQPAAGQSVRLHADIIEGIDKETAGKINKDIKAQKLKVKVTIEADKLRVSSASRDALQDVIAFLKTQDYGQPLQYTNYRQGFAVANTHLDSAQTDQIMPSVAFLTLGCAKNEVDSARMTRQVRNAGYQVVQDLSAADAVIVNTCCFIQPATEESIDTIFEICGLPNFAQGSAKLIVAGCMPARYGDDLAESLPEARAFVPCSREDDIVGVLGGLFGTQDTSAHVHDACLPQCSAQELVSAVEAVAPYDMYGQANVATFVKISDGCDRFCSFCAIPFIRGAYHSFTLEDICNTVEQRIAEGAREITLIAQDTGRWGEDFNPPLTTAFLLDTLAQRFSNVWFRLMYIEPEGITDELLGVIRNHENVCNYLDMPLQHASAKVLTDMNRKGCGEQFIALIEHIRDMVPEITLRTTLIAGFPGETDEDFGELMDFLEEAELDYVGVFPYSLEEGTAAALMDDQLEEDIKIDRAQEVRDLCDTISMARVQQRIDSTVRVLVIGYEEDGQLFGRAECQAPEVDGVIYLDQGTPGEFVTVKVIDTFAYEMEGDVIRG